MKLSSIFDGHWDAFVRGKPYLLSTAHYRAAESVRACRTAALGAQVYHCEPCVRKHLQYHSCHHRACPQCDKHKQHEWSQKQEGKLLDTGYYMITFTLPEELRRACQQNQAWFYGLMFDAVRDTLKALDLPGKRVLPENAKLAHTAGFTAVLHTWTREMQYHPHIHVVMPGLSLTKDAQRIQRPKGADYLIPHRAIAKRFKILLRRDIIARDKEQDSQILSSIKPRVWNKRWVVDVQSVGGGRSALRYLARYVHRTAISEQRIHGETADGGIKINCQNSRTKEWRMLTLRPHEFLRRWCLHILPKGFMRVRHYGYLSAAAKEKLGQIRGILQMPTPDPVPKSAPVRPECSCCKQPMKLTGTLTRDGLWVPAPVNVLEMFLAALKTPPVRARRPPSPSPNTG